jgi:hypothetical protein
MPKQDKTTAQAEAPKAKRAVLTPEQRIAKAEADLAALRQKAEARKNKARDEAWDKRAKLIARRDELNAKIAKIDAEFPQDEDASTEGDES